MASERSKRRDFLSLSFITKSISTKLLIKKKKTRCLILKALHKLRKKIARKTSVVQADSKVTFHTVRSSISLFTRY